MKIVGHESNNLRDNFKHGKPLKCSHKRSTNNTVISFQIKYPVDCSDYHAEDIKATTEYAHSEL
jgi:hypothetical protein